MRPVLNKPAQDSQGDPFTSLAESKESLNWSEHEGETCTVILTGDSL